MARLQVVDYICIDWDRSQLNPIFSHDIVFIALSLGSASALGNKNNITLILGFNYTIYSSVLDLSDSFRLPYPLQSRLSGKLSVTSGEDYSSINYTYFCVL